MAVDHYLHWLDFERWERLPFIWGGHSDSTVRAGEHNCIAVKIADGCDVESLIVLHLSKGVKWTMS